MATATSTPSAGAGARVHIQRFGTFLSNMVMPNIGAFIAWGLITAMFIEVGWLPRYFGIGDSPDSWVAKFGGWGDFAGGGIVGPMIVYLLPLLIAYTGGKTIYDTRGGVVGAIATMGVIVGTEIPMFMGAMIMGPLGGWSMKKIDAIWDGKIKPGFEMLVNNFAAGIWGAILAMFGFVVMSPVVTWIADRLGEGVDFLVSNNLLPFTSLIIEPAKVLFLNNALNHGVLTPLGTQEAVEQGKSVLFLLEANPAAGAGLLLAYMMFGKGLAKASAPGAFIIHFFGGIHEIYFPFVLMKPKLIVAMIAGGFTQILINVIFSSGLRAPAAPGSVFAVYAQVPGDSVVGVTLSILGGAAASFAVAAILLEAGQDRGGRGPAGPRDRADGGLEGQGVLGVLRADRWRRRHRRRHPPGREDRVRVRRGHGLLRHGCLGAPQEGPRRRLHLGHRGQPGHRQPHRRPGRGGHPPGPDRPGTAEDRPRRSTCRWRTSSAARGTTRSSRSSATPMVGRAVRDCTE